MVVHQRRSGCYEPHDGWQEEVKVAGFHVPEKAKMKCNF